MSIKSIEEALEVEPVGIVKMFFLSILCLLYYPITLLAKAAYPVLCGLESLFAYSDEYVEEEYEEDDEELMFSGSKAKESDRGFDNSSYFDFKFQHFPGPVDSSGEIL